MDASSRDANRHRTRVALGGVLVDRLDRDTAMAALGRFLSDGDKHQVVTVNTDFIRIAEADENYRRLLNSADLAIADGMPLVWISRLLGAPIPERIAGLDLAEECCALAVRAGIGVFFLGAAPGVAEHAARALELRHPGLRIAGVYAPPFGVHTPEVEAEMVARIGAAGRCVLLVAFGAPRQDRFIRSHLHEMDVALAMGVGCAFDIFAGAVRRAPRWMQRSGLEWAWRLSQEPARLWRRYLLEDIPFALRLVAGAIRERAPAAHPR